MNKVEGLHHLAITTTNIKKQIEYFSDVLGMELVALYWMHGVENTLHGFMRLNDESAIAFVQAPEIRDIDVNIGTTHAGNPTGPCAAGTTQHIALAVKNGEELLAIRDRIRSKGVPVIGPVDHGFCASIYFAGHENLTLELSYSEEPIDQEKWIDPKVVELCDISQEELAGYKVSADFESQGGALPQPGLESDGPHLTGFPEGVYEVMLGMSDAEVSAAMDETEPPVNVAGH